MPYLTNRGSSGRRRNGGGGGWTKGKRNNAITGSVAVMLNPFTNMSVIPRIPDGLCTYSTGFREQVTAGLPSMAQTWVMIFYPGFYSPFYLANSTAPGDITVGRSEAGWTYAHTGKLNTFDVAKLESARIVSQGLSIKCTSNAQTNDGYFEAIRLSGNSLDGETVSLTGLANNPTYVHGKIRDIESYSFQLKPQNESSFVDMDRLQVLAVTEKETDAAMGNTGGESEGGTKQGKPAAQTPVTETPVVPGEPASNVNLTTMVDPALDAILIKFTSGTEGKTDLFFHSVQNIEVIYDETSELAKFMTSAPKDLQALEKARSTLTSNMKACRSIYHAR